MSYFDKKYFNKNALTENISHFSYRDQLDVVINHRQVEGFGTLGHYHDDYGQVNVYYKGAPIIVDPGTISYASYSTMLDTCNFHNMPYVKGQESLKRIAKFEKYFPASVSKYTRNGNVSVQSYDQYGKKKRVLFTKELEFLDTFSLSGQTVINFYIPIDFSIEQKKEKNLIILTNNNLIISFASSSMSGVNIYTSFMAQGYSKKKSVKVISFSFNDFNNPNKFRWSIKIND